MLSRVLLSFLFGFSFVVSVHAQDLANPFSLDGDEAETSDASRPVQKDQVPQAPSKTREAKGQAETEPAPLPAPEEASAKKDDDLASRPSIPALNSPVVDKAGLLAAQQSSLLEKKIRAIHKQGGPQLQILILESLQGFPIEQYSIAVAEAWKIGSKNKGDGVIILMSKEDREVRIEVGQGVEGELTDVESHQIIQYAMIPEFKRGKFAKGFENAVDAVAGEFGMESYDANGLTPPKDLAKIRRSKKQMVSLLLPLIIFFATFPVIIKLLGKNPLIRSAVGAAYMGALTFFLVGQLFFIVLAVFFGFFIGLIGPLNFLMVMLSHSGRGSYYGRGGGLGGGWSGGGGGFSGGGASGRW